MWNLSPFPQDAQWLTMKYGMLFVLRFY